MIAMRSKCHSSLMVEFGFVLLPCMNHYRVNGRPPVLQNVGVETELVVKNTCDLL
jgi:hypothetical protein